MLTPRFVCSFLKNLLDCTKCLINICLLCSCVLGTITFVGPFYGTVNRGKFTSSLVHQFQDLSTGCTLYCTVSRRGQEGFEPFAHLYALNVIASTSRFFVFFNNFRKHGHSGVLQLFTAPSLGESRKKSRCDTNFVRGTCGTALGIYSVYYRNTFLTSMILPSIDAVLNNVSSTSSAYPCTASSGVLHASPSTMLLSRVAAAGGAPRLADLREGLHSASDLVML